MSLFGVYQKVFHHHILCLAHLSAARELSMGVAVVSVVFMIWDNRNRCTRSVPDGSQPRGSRREPEHGGTVFLLVALSGHEFVDLTTYGGELANMEPGGGREPDADGEPDKRAARQQWSKGN